MASISSLTPAQIQQAVKTGKNPVTGETLSPVEISALLANIKPAEKSEEKDVSKLLAGSGTEAKDDTGLVIEISISRVSQKSVPTLNKEQEKGRDAVAKGLGIESELLQKYIEGDGSELTDPKNGISRTPEEEKSFYANLKQLIKDCPFKGTEPYLYPDKYTDAQNPTDKANQPDCGIGAGDYLREHSNNPYIQNLTRAQATRLVMLMQPDIQENQEKGSLDSTGCGDKNATDKYPWVAFSVDTVMKSTEQLESDNPASLEKQKDGAGNGTDTWLIGYRPKAEGRIGIPAAKVGADGKTDDSSIISYVKDRNIAREYGPSAGMYVSLSENIERLDKEGNNDGFVTLKEAEEFHRKKQIAQGVSPDKLKTYTDIDKIPDNVGLRVALIKEIEIKGYNAIDENGKLYRNSDPNYTGSIPIEKLLEEIPKK